MFQVIWYFPAALSPKNGKTNSRSVGPLDLFRLHFLQLDSLAVPFLLRILRNYIKASGPLGVLRTNHDSDSMISRVTPWGALIFNYRRYSFWNIEPLKSDWVVMKSSFCTFSVNEKGEERVDFCHQEVSFLNFVVQSCNPLLEMTAERDCIQRFFADRLSGLQNCSWLSLQH